MDGRRARTARTRENIVDAALALMDAGDLRPTAAAIAAKAGLSVRSVFQHFGDLQDLFLEVADRQTNRVAVLYASPGYEGGLESRIDAFVAHRGRLYDTISPLRRAAMLQASFSPPIAARLELARSLHRIDLEMAFGPELAAARAAGDATLMEALSAATSFVVWDELRRLAGLEAQAAGAALRLVVSALFASAPR